MVPDYSKFPPEHIPISLEALQKLHRQIDTPAVLIIEERMQKNIRFIQALANKTKCRLRPHIKTHKSAELAKRQLKAGAVGITVAKLGEAEAMQQAGITDIFVANQIAHPHKIRRLLKLHRKGRVIIGLDHPRQIDLLRPVFMPYNKPLEARIEIDSGLNRCGVRSKEALLELANRIAREPWLKLEGIFTHAGQAYGAASPEAIAHIGKEEGRIVAEAKGWLEEAGLQIETVSVGSTPTVNYSAQNEQVNEIRPGNYIFYDGIQMALGVCRPDQCALFVLATVISRPAPDRIVIDAGSKALNLDRGAHARSNLKGYGMPVHHSGFLSGLSEEHGVIQIPPNTSLRIGDPLLILPNHACAVANLYEKYYLVDANLQIGETSVTARGRSQ